MHPHIGPSRCGEKADIVADPEGIHTADGGPSLYRLAPIPHPGINSCSAALSTVPDSGVGQIDVGDLTAGDLICVRTDKRNIALVSVDGVTNTGGELTKVILSFTVWKP